jgi:hypothetical protein
METAGRSSCLLLIAWGLISLSGCMSRGNPVEPGGGEYTAESPSEGSLWGSVAVVNKYQERMQDKGGVIVTIEGTPRSTISSFSGFWEFTELPEGEYTITWTKPGFGYSRKVGIQYPGTGSVHGPKAQISEIPNFAIGGLVDSSGTDAVYVKGTITGEPTPVSFARFYLGRSPTVSYLANNHDTSFARQLFVPPGDGTTSSHSDGDDGMALPRSFTLLLQGDELRGAGFARGSVVYLIGYSDSPQAQSYVDPQTKKRFYTTINMAPSNVLRVIVP